jgi:ferredoxin-nitrite reductase
MNPASDFSEEQKQYLHGFVSGADAARAMQGLPTFAETLKVALGLAAGAPAAKPDAPTYTGPDALGLAAQDRVLAEGKKLTPQEEAKRKRHPLDTWDDLTRHCDEGAFPKGTDVLAFKYHGLFYVAPAQDAYMCRLRFPGGIVTSAQFRGVAQIADELAGGYADVTTRANLQLREIPAKDGVAVLNGLHDLGILNRGAGADNVRNVTGSPTAGIDPQELIDVRPLCRALHHHILNHRELYGLPRKFNVAFDGGGSVSALEDTNDVGFTAVRVPEGEEIPAGVYFRLALGGITGHKDFARDTGVLVQPEECVAVAAAVIRVFIEQGDRTDRAKARLKYVLDRWGFDKFLEETQKHLSFPLRRFPLDRCEPRPAPAKHGHLGIHPQKQEGLVYVGVLLPVGRLTTDQMRGLADLADRHGSGTIRLTVWQNMIVSDVPEDQVPDVKRQIEALGLHWDATDVRGGLVACTGNAGCKFAASDTKRHALAIAEHVEGRVKLDQPINIHLTGCPHSCAQHYLGDVGLLGTTVEDGDDTVEGYHVFVGGGYGADRFLGREIFRGVKADDAPATVERMLRAYLDCRQGGESFNDFVRRHATDTLQEMFARPELAATP